MVGQRAGRRATRESFGTDGGRYYEGGWRADLKHGRGLYVARDGTRFEGEWFEGNKCGEGRAAETHNPPLKHIHTSVKAGGYTNTYCDL